MTQRHVHYEAAFEDYLRSQGTPYVPVNEGRKAIFSGARVKSFDFLVHRKGGSKWLVDIKGRKYPYDTTPSKRYWENWATRSDIDGLTAWQDVFGEGFEAVLIFAYWLLGPEERFPTAHVHTHRDRHYAFMSISLNAYRTHCRRRSAKWDTVALPAAIFRRLAKPIQQT